MNRKDACVFIKAHGSNEVVMCVHVDDFMITCADDEELESIMSRLEKEYMALTVLRDGCDAQLLRDAARFRRIRSVHNQCAEVCPRVIPRGEECNR